MLIQLSISYYRCLRINTSLSLESNKEIVSLYLDIVIGKLISILAKNILKRRHSSFPPPPPFQFKHKREDHVCRLLLTFSNKIYHTIGLKKEKLKNKNYFLSSFIKKNIGKIK